MKIKITLAPAVHPKHGITLDREFEVITGDDIEDHETWVLGDAGEGVLLHDWEYEEVK